MEITNIEKSEKRLCPILDNALTDSGLFCSSVFLNAAKERFYRLATPGSFLPIAYEPQNETAALAFIKKLCATVECGQDFDFQPRLMVSDELRNSKVLLYSETPLDIANCVNLDMANSVDLPANIATMSKEHRANFAFLVNPPIDGETSYIALNMLRNIALKHKLIIIAFLKLDEAADGLNNYLANYLSDLCLIGKGTVITKADSAKGETTDYYYFRYGRPIPERIIFDINEDGVLYVPQGLAKLLRVERCAKMLAKPLTLSKFEGTLFGALGGEFEAKTITSMLSEACNNGILIKSGIGKKALISKPSESGATRKPYSGNIAVTALWNRHRAENDYTHSRKSLVRFGESVLLSPDEENMELVCKAFTKGLISGVVSGEGFLDYKIKTDKRNTLILCVGDGYNISEQSLNENAKAATAYVRYADASITDLNFLHWLKAECNAHQPDFVFILGLERVLISLYQTNRQLCDEITKTAKRLGIVIFSTLHKPLLNIGDFVGVDMWQLFPLFPHELQQKIIKRYDEYRNGKGTPFFYCVEASKDKHSFLSQFIFRDGLRFSTETSENRKAYVTSIFYGCKNTPYTDVWDNLSNEVVSERLIKEAKRLNLIQEKNGYISYIGFGHE